MIRPLSAVKIPGKPAKGFILPPYRGQMQLPVAPATIFEVPVVRVPVAEREGFCKSCRFFMPAAQLALPFELEGEGIDPELFLCGHPGCGCWKNRGRLDPWNRVRCPHRKW